MQEGDPGGSPFYLAQACGGQGSVEFHGQRAVAEIVTGAGNGRRRFRTGMDRFFPNKPIHSFEVSCLCPG